MRIFSTTPTICFGYVSVNFGEYREMTGFASSFFSTQILEAYDALSVVLGYPKNSPFVRQEIALAEANPDTFLDITQMSPADARGVLELTRILRLVYDLEQGVIGVDKPLIDGCFIANLNEGLSLSFTVHVR